MVGRERATRNERDIYAEKWGHQECGLLQPEDRLRTREGLSFFGSKSQRWPKSKGSDAFLGME